MCISTVCTFLLLSLTYGCIRPASVAQLAETQCAPTGTVCRRSRGSIPGSAGRFRVRISGAHALRLISQAGK